jgi:hypothetical protein
MCPCISSKSEYATCGKSAEGMMSPSVYERENYCFGLYELCPLFYKIEAGEVRADMPACLDPVSV